LATYLVVYQHVPVQRAAQLIADVTGARPSTGWTSSVIVATSEQLADTDALIRTLLILAHVLHVDETTINVNGYRWWLHVAATQKLTSYFLHRSRGRTAVTEFGILPAFAGVCVHDALPVYDGPDYASATHAFCGEHIARELVAAGQADPDTAWPRAALGAFYELNTATHRARAQNLTQIPPDVGDPLLHRWKHALLCGLADNPRRHGFKQSKTRNLLTRLTTAGTSRCCCSPATCAWVSPTIKRSEICDPPKPNSKSPAATAPAAAPKHGGGSAVTSPPCAKTVSPSSPDSAAPSPETPGPAAT